jgi:FkbM family methyltransferase
MKTILKRILFNFYLWYIHKSPIKNGNAFLGRIINYFDPIPYKINDIELYLNPSAFVDQSLIYLNSHDDEVNKWIDKYITKNDTFLDIGANIGYFSLYAAKIKNCNVIAFEPSQRELIRFYQNIIRNKLNNITLYPFGLGKESLTTTLNLASFQNPGQNSILKNLNFTSTEQQIVNIKRLSEVVTTEQLKQIRLIKIDVEGYEINVLEGMQDCMIFLQNAKFVIEITTFIDSIEQSTDAKLIYTFFKKNGFNPFFGLKNNHQYNELFSFHV